jgi:hypothetical protein
MVVAAAEDKESCDRLGMLHVSKNDNEQRRGTDWKVKGGSKETPYLNPMKIVTETPHCPSCKPPNDIHITTRNPPDVNNDDIGHR